MEQGWSDACLLELIAEFLESRDQLKPLIAHLEATALEDAAADDDEGGPEEEDLITPDHRRFYSYGGTGAVVVDVAEGEGWQAAVKAYMDKDLFWPNVWFISDHGNYCLLSLQDSERPSMDAFICGDSHITALAAYAAHHRVCGFGPGDIEKIGRILHEANYKSVDYGYDETNERDFAVCPWAQSRTFTPIQIIKAATCLDYQSCEHPDWDSSEARGILDAIILTAERHLPGYDDADWEIRRP